VENIWQAGGFVPSECIEWPHLRECGANAFAFARFRCFNFPPRLAKLGPYAFAYSSLETVTIPDSVTEIGAGCFFFCRFLRDVTLGRGVRKLPAGVFGRCRSLQFVVAISPLESLGVLALEDTESLREFNFGSANIGARSFIGSGLICLTLSGNPSRVCGNDAFEFCRSLLQVKIDLRDIRSRLFRNCSALESVTLTDPVITIGSEAFVNCSCLKLINLSNLCPDASLSESAFAGSGLVEITLPEQLKSIGNEVFRGCTSLMIARFPQVVDTVGYAVFEGCTSLRRLVLGDVVREWKNPESFLGGVQVTRLELVGRDFCRISRCPIESWVSREGSVVSVNFVGEKIGGFVIGSL
jgi:hypothetical protein